MLLVIYCDVLTAYLEQFVLVSNFRVQQFAIDSEKRPSQYPKVASGIMRCFILAGPKLKYIQFSVT